MICDIKKYSKNHFDGICKWNTRTQFLIDD